MNNEDISIQQRTKKFAIRVINAYVQLSKKQFDDAAKVLSKQFLRSGTSIGGDLPTLTYRYRRGLPSCP